jgi:threonine dehydratase
LIFCAIQTKLLLATKGNGQITGEYVMGMQVPPHEMAQWQAFLDTLRLSYWGENKNPTYKLFLG